MHKLIPICFALLSIGLNAQNVADFTLTDTKGQTHHLFDYLGKKQAVVIDFFLETCGNCGPAAALLEQIYQDYGANQGWIKVLGMECDTATSAEVDAWMSNNGATYPAIAGLDAHNYWKTNWQPMLGGQFNQCIGIFPTAFTNPQNSYIDFIHIGLMTATQQQDLIDKLHQYGFWASLNERSEPITSLQVYPNPVSDRFKYQLEGIPLGGANYAIIGITGKQVQSGELQAEIDCSGLNPGIYILEVSGKNSIFRTQFIKAN